jgi:formyltetrahydrofolate deformylase
MTGVDPTVERRYVITLSCPDTTGIVAEISGFLARAGGWIVEAGYHSDPDTGWFFTRQVVRADSLPFDVAALRAQFGEVAARLGGSWTISDTGVAKRAVLLVSKEAHCLHDLLGRVATGELPARLEAVVGNHEGIGDIVRAHGVPFHHVDFPSGAAAKAEAFAQVGKLVDAVNPDAIVLARFMQILPPQLCDAWAGRALNIHHSFLPSFVGARPYHQAHARGVKLIGATCHYVTPDLDAGPIVEQDVIRVDHADTVADMVRRGRDIERLVLARGLRWHLEDRVLVHGNKTVVFR